jgi:DNA-binding response OmpR family regulator
LAESVSPILVIDDEPEIREILTTLLVDEGHPIVTAANGIDAASLRLSADPALMILDLNLGDYAGETVAALLESHFTRRVPILVTSIDPRLRERTSALRGVVALLRKPYDVNDLLSIVQAILKRSDPRSANRASGRAISHGEAPNLAVGPQAASSTNLNETTTG